MPEADEMGAVFRQTVAEGGDIVDLGHTARRHGWGRHSTLAAKALRSGFGIPLTEALHFAAWIEGESDDTESLRKAVPTPLR